MLTKGDNNQACCRCLVPVCPLQWSTCQVDDRGLYAARQKNAEDCLMTLTRAKCARCKWRQLFLSKKEIMGRARYLVCQTGGCSILFSRDL